MGSGALNLRSRNASRIVVEIVAEYDKVGNYTGFYFSADTIQLISEIGAGIDIDLVERM